MDDIEGIAQALKPWFNEKNLFIISSDFSHYPAYKNARLSDSLCASAILTNSVSNLQNTIQIIEEADIPDLSTTMCGKSAVMTLLSITQEQKDLEYQHLMYRNSGQKEIGNLEKVVGYHAFSVRRKENSGLRKDQKALLLKVARASLEVYPQNRRGRKI